MRARWLIGEYIGRESTHASTFPFEDFFEYFFRTFLRTFFNFFEFKTYGEDDDIGCGELWGVSGVAGTILAGLVVRPNKGAQHWFQR